MRRKEREAAKRAARIVRRKSAQAAFSAYLNAAGDVAVTNALEHLINEHARPVIMSIVNKKFDVNLVWIQARTGPQPSFELDAEDIYADTRLTFMVKVSSLRDDRANNANGDNDYIEDIPGYVARLTFNGFSMHMRRRYPERHRLRSKVRYTLQPPHKHGLAEWDRMGYQLCGFKKWKEENKERALGERLHTWRNNPEAFRNDVLEGVPPETFKFPDLLAKTFSWIGSPVEIDDLVNGLMDLYHVAEEETAGG